MQVTESTKQRAEGRETRDTTREMVLNRTVAGYVYRSFFVICLLELEALANKFALSDGVFNDEL